MTEDKNTLENFREEIDSIDNQILELLNQRVEVVKKVGAFKDSLGTDRSIIRPGREATMIRRIANEAEHNLPKAAIAMIWRIIISSAINVEEETKISVYAPSGDRECFWLAREYFGAFTNAVQKSAILDVANDILKREASIGVLPLCDENAKDPWWIKIIDTDAKIFAKVPFIKVKPSDKYPIVAIGFVPPEGTGEDESFWAAKKDSLSAQEIDSAFRQAGLASTVMQDSEKGHCLLRLEGFISEDDDRIKAADEIINNKNCKLSYLGSYAKPIIFD